MDPAYKVALSTELDGLRKSPDRPAKYRRIAEVLDQLGEKPGPGDQAPEEYAVNQAPRERAVKPKGA